MPVLYGISCEWIEYNCRIFQKSVSSFNEVSTDEHTDELAVEVDDSDTGNEDFSLSDDNIDLLFARALNTLTSFHFICIVIIIILIKSNQ